jgi:drug/metabolite transporter (DMT)-like permease
MIAAAILWPLLRLDAGAARLSATEAKAWWHSAAVVSGLFVLAAMFQQIAYQWTSVTNASFLVNTCTVMTPVLAWVLIRQRTGHNILVAAAITLLGAWLMSGRPSGLGNLNTGDAACLASALFYAGWAIALGRHATRHGRPIALTLVQFVVTFLVLAPMALAVEAPTLAGAVAAGPEILFLAVFSTAGACLLTTLAQRWIPASVAVVLLSLESVFGTLAAVVILGEGVSAAAMAGGALILLAVAVAVFGSKTMSALRGARALAGG